MNDLALVTTNFEDYVIESGAHPAGMGGYQMVLRFPNGFGASIVRTPFSYGGPTLFELAVLDFAGDDQGDITYDTPITDDVLGYLAPGDCLVALGQIMALAEKEGGDA